jgi:beta-phosphoglucomutase-like phosphatase (HAD superfamily)
MKHRTIALAARQKTFSCSAVLILLGALLMPIPDAVAQRTERALTRQDVRDYIRLRIDLHKKQEEMKANADQYDDVIHAFFQWQSEFLQARGRSRESFEALEKRIMAAETAMEMVADSAEYRTRLRNNRKAIRMSEHYSDAEKEEALAQYARQDSIRQARHIEPTRRDWPAVRPYLEALEHLTTYVALNRPDPPDLDALPPANE